MGLLIALSDDCRCRLMLDVGVISCSFLPASELFSVFDEERRFGRQQQLNPTIRNIAPDPSDPIAPKFSQWKTSCPRPKGTPDTCTNPSSIPKDLYQWVPSTGAFECLRAAI